MWKWKSSNTFVKVAPSDIDTDWWDINHFSSYQPTNSKMPQNPTHWRSAVSLRVYFSLRERVSLFSLAISVKMVGYKHYLLWILNDSVSCPEVSCVLCSWSWKHIRWVAACDSCPNSAHTLRGVRIMQPTGTSLLARDPEWSWRTKWVPLFS